MDSPNASGYVPLSLVDTLTKPSRSYRSVQAAPSATPSLSSSRSYHHAHSASIHALAAKERSEQARREAAAISETLGLETPGPSRRTLNNNYSYDVESTPRPQHSEVVSLKSQLKDKDQEIAALRRELGLVQKDKKELIGKLDRLEQSNNASSSNGGIRGGLDATQVEELVKQFNDQEALLGGYQREAEKSLAELDRLRNKERRLNDWFEKMYGPSWAEELNLTDKPSLSSSPTIRTKLSSRPSILPTPASSSSSSIFSDPGTTPSTTQDSSPVGETPAQSLNIRSNDPTLSPLALKQHLESIQALIRGMETRLIARGVELETVEKRARSEARTAESKRIELENLLSLNSQGVRA
ncbi:hypothetical protein JCM3765_006517 [Sporobolomyces pararoseus]